MSGEKKTKKTCRRRMGKHVADTKAVAHVSSGFRSLMETLTRKRRVSKKPGWRRPKERTTCILQRSACWKRVKEGKNGNK